jgi:hypothetical protein
MVGLDQQSMALSAEPTGPTHSRLKTHKDAIRHRIALDSHIIGLPDYSIMIGLDQQSMAL